MLSQGIQQCPQKQFRLFLRPLDTMLLIVLFMLQSMTHSLKDGRNRRVSDLRNKHPMYIGI